MGLLDFCYGELFDPKVHVRIGDANFPFSRHFFRNISPTLFACCGRELMTQAFSQRSNSQPFPTHRFPISSERKIRWIQRPSGGFTDPLLSFNGAFGFFTSVTFSIQKVHVRIGGASYTLLQGISFVHIPLPLFCV